MSLVGRENAYRCDDCGKFTTTIDVDEGVTPMFLGCRATPGCKGRAVSSCYPEGPRPAHIPPPAFEWYRPTPKQARRMGREMADHVARGGLALRPVRAGNPDPETGDAT